MLFGLILMIHGLIFRPEMPEVTQLPEIDYSRFNENNIDIKKIFSSMGGLAYSC